LPSERIKIIGPRTFTDDAVASDLIRSGLPFSFSDVAGRVEEVVRLWLELADRFSAAFALYFGGLYRPPAYSDLRLWLLIQALSLYQARRERVASAASEADRVS